MNKKSTAINSATQIVFLVILGLAIVFAITTMRAASPRSLSPNQGSTPGLTDSIVPGPDETQTVAAIITFKAIGEATYSATTRTPVTPIYLPTGIHDDQQVQISAALLFIEAQNAWGGFIDGYRFALYAGALQSDPDQGVVGMVTSLPEGTKFEQFVTLSKHGALRVVGEQNDRMTLIAADGTIFYFDLPTRQFVASLTEVAPSTTPSPLVTPAPTGIPYPLPTAPDSSIP